MEQKSFFNKPISDYFITGFVFLVGSISLIALYIIAKEPFLKFLRDLISSGFIFYYYLWFKAVILDFIRIKKAEPMTMPGFVFMVYGFQATTFWMAQDLVFNSSHFHFANFNKTEQYLLIQNPTAFWFSVEIISTALFFPLRSFIKILANISLEGVLMVDILRYFLFMIFAFLASLFISTF